MTTCSDLIEKVNRRLVPAQRAQVLQLTNAYTSGASTMTLSDPSSGNALSAATPGTILAIDLELFLVLGATGSTFTVQGGYNGSTPANHAQNALVYVNPKFSRFDILNALNEDLDDLTSPDNGLFQVKTVDITYNPVFVGYDLAGVAADFIDVLEIRFKTALPAQYWPPVKRWEVHRNMTDSMFPSGTALFVRDGGWPGLPMHVLYKARYASFVNLTDDAQTVCGLSYTARELPWLGAAISLVAGREVKRNFTEAQPDPRKAQEVPPGAVMASTNGLLRLRNQRIMAEAQRLDNQYGYVARKD